MEDLLNIQLILKQRMETLIINYKKDGIEKRTNTYYQQKLSEFQTLWKRFEEGHENIMLFILQHDPEQIKAYAENETYYEMDSFFNDNYDMIEEQYKIEFPDTPVETTTFNQSQNDLSINQSTNKSYEYQSLSNTSVQNPIFIPKNSKVNPSQENAINLFHINEGTQNTVLLATALVKIISPTGKEGIISTLIDQESEAFISKNLTQQFNLKNESIPTNVQELEKKIEVTSLILKIIPSTLPSNYISKTNWDHVSQLKLADPQFYEPGQINISLGADVFNQIILDGVMKGKSGIPVAQKTIFDWMLSGEIKQQKTSKELVNNFHVCTIIEKETLCEKPYKETITHLPNGQYKLQVPIKIENINKHQWKSRNIYLSRKQL